MVQQHFKHSPIMDLKKSLEARAEAAYAGYATSQVGPPGALLRTCHVEGM